MEEETFWEEGDQTVMCCTDAVARELGFVSRWEGLCVDFELVRDRVERFMQKVFERFARGWHKKAVAI